MPARRGDTFYTAVASTISVTFIRTAGSYLGGYVFGLGIVGIWLGVLADQISRFCLHRHGLRRENGRRSKFRKIEKESVND